MLIFTEKIPPRRPEIYDSKVDAASKTRKKRIIGLRI
jgi:hypothetical protein